MIKKRAIIQNTAMKEKNLHSGQLARTVKKCVTRMMYGLLADEDSRSQVHHTWDCSSRTLPYHMPGGQWDLNEQIKKIKNDDVHQIQHTLLCTDEAL